MNILQVKDKKTEILCEKAKMNQKTWSSFWETIVTDLLHSKHRTLSEGSESHGERWEDYLDDYLESGIAERFWGKNTDEIWSLQKSDEEPDLAEIRMFVRQTVQYGISLMRSIPKNQGKGNWLVSLGKQTETKDYSSRNTKSALGKHGLQASVLSNAPQSGNPSPCKRRMTQPPSAMNTRRTGFSFPALNSTKPSFPITPSRAAKTTLGKSNTPQRHWILKEMNVVHNKLHPELSSKSPWKKIPPAVQPELSTARSDASTKAKSINISFAYPLVVDKDKYGISDSNPLSTNVEALPQPDLDLARLPEPARTEVSSIQGEQAVQRATSDHVKEAESSNDIKEMSTIRNTRPALTLQTVVVPDTVSTSHFMHVPDGFTIADFLRVLSRKHRLIPAQLQRLTSISVKMLGTNLLIDLTDSDRDWDWEAWMALFGKDGGLVQVLAHME